MAEWSYSIASKNLTQDIQRDQAEIQAMIEAHAEDGFELVAAVPHPSGYLMLIFKKAN